MEKYTAPKYLSDAFNCPYCNVYAHQKWYFNLKGYNNQYGSNLDGLSFNVCEKCGKYVLWINESIIYPFESNVPLPLQEMPDNVKEYYNEARNIFNMSYRGALVLLRIALQELMKELGYESKYLHKNINKILNDDDIEEQVKDAVNIIRNYGNDSAHPDIEIHGDKDTTIFLFNLMNYIVEDRIIRPSKMEKLKEMRESTT